MERSIEALQEAMREFALAREWDQFHTPKNLATALSVEAAELLEHFQWLTDAQSQALDESKRAAVAEEVADVLLYLIRFADKLGIDPIEAAWKKLEVNASKYPVDLARGNIKKYTEL